MPRAGASLPTSAACNEETASVTWVPTSIWPNTYVDASTGAKLWSFNLGSFQVQILFDKFFHAFLATHA